MSDGMANCQEISFSLFGFMCDEWVDQFGEESFCGMTEGNIGKYVL
jgi:hypothetical protein